MSLTARERIPQPMVIDGIVRNDFNSRTLVVKRPENASGYQKLAWRTAHEHLYRAEQAGWRAVGAPTLWASGAGQTNIAHGLPGDNLELHFHFPPTADSPYTKLMSRPALTCFVTVDRSTGFFVGVRFRHASGGAAA